MIQKDVKHKPARSARRMAALLFWFISAQALALLFVVALLRVFFFDRALMALWLNLFTFYIYLPAYFILAAAAVARRKAFIVAAVIIVLFHLAITLPHIVGGKMDPQTAVGEPIRIFNANLFFNNQEFTSMIDEIAAADADILVFQEYSSPWDQALGESRIADDYPYRFLNTADTPFGSAIWSKRPLSNGEVWTVEGLDMVRATVEIDGQPVRLYDLHPPPPLRNLSWWNSIYDGFASEIANESTPVIAIGDYNMGQHNRRYIELQKQGLLNLHQELGRGTAVSWPNGTKSVPPVRLDHAFVTPEIIGLSISEGVGKGSDHKPIIVDLALRSNAE